MMAGEPTYEELKKKVAELEAELAARREKTPGRTAPGARPSSRARFSDIFDLDKIQEMLDAFAGAAGVSAVLTEPDGRPITRPSNFCRLCGEVIRKTEIGAASCARSCCMIDRFNPGGPAIQPCSSAGLWQAGARVRVEDETLAHLIIGQVRLDDQGDEEMMKYAGEIGADEETYGRALAEIPVTPRERFRQVAAAAFHIADQMSETARRTLRLNQLSARRERDREGARRAEKKARRAERTLNAIAKAAPDIIYRLDRNGKISFISDAV
ncbi:MAG: histidine kinase, partial [Desulfobacterales bacterium]|nr:histidine kinase [Desulfobacterales bacterium]